MKLDFVVELVVWAAVYKHLLAFVAERINQGGCQQNASDVSLIELQTIKC